MFIDHQAKHCRASCAIKECQKIEYPKPDGVYSFDLLENLARSGPARVECWAIRSGRGSVLRADTFFLGPWRLFWSWRPVPFSGLKGKPRGSHHSDPLWYRWDWFQGTPKGNASMFGIEEAKGKPSWCHWGPFKWAIKTPLHFFRVSPSLGFLLREKMAVIPLPTEVLTWRVWSVFLGTLVPCRDVLKGGPAFSFRASLLSGCEI